MKQIKTKVLKPLFPNVGIEMAYRRKLEELIADMVASVTYWIEAKYKNNSPEIAMDARDRRVTAVETQVGRNRVWQAYIDGRIVRGRTGVARSFRSQEAAESAGLREAGVNAALTEALPFRSPPIPFEDLPLAVSPAETLQTTINNLTQRWLQKFDEAADKLADYFTRDVAERTDAQLRRILKDGGISVRFKMTPAQIDIADATVHANVSLIKSIPRRYLSNVEGIVMRSVQTGRDLGQLSADLQREHGVTKRRAALISRDQNNKATSAFQRARQQEIGITEAVWMHSHAGKEPRPSHVKMNGKRYDINEGLYDPTEKRNVFPGELINCRCTSRSVVVGFN